MVKQKGPISPRVVSSAFVEQDGKFLIVFDPNFKVWRVPGGRVDFDEQLEQTLAREMKEELNIEIENPKFLGFGQDHQFHFTENKEKSRLIMYFHVKTSHAVEVDPEEAEQHKWVSWADLKSHENVEGALTDFFERNPNIDL